MMRAWAAPLGLGATCVAGLVLALLYDGVADRVALALIAVPLALLADRLVRRRRSPVTRNEP